MQYWHLMMVPVVFLDDCDDLRDALTSILELQLGVECLCLKNFAEILVHSEVVLKARVVILDINLGENQPNGLDAHNWLKSQKFQGKIYFLTGHAATNPLVMKARQTGAQ